MTRVSAHESSESGVRAWHESGPELGLDTCPIFNLPKCQPAAHDYVGPRSADMRRCGRAGKKFRSSRTDIRSLLKLPHSIFVVENYMPDNVGRSTRAYRDDFECVQMQWSDARSPGASQNQMRAPKILCGRSFNE